MEGIFLYNQTEAILAQYDIEVKQTTKGRGSYICDTDKGKRVLLPFRGSPERGEALKKYLESLSELGFETERLYETKEGKAVSKDEGTGEKFILKSLQEGNELDSSKAEDMQAAAVLLGRYHRLAKQISTEIIPQIFEETGISVTETKKKHYRELIKIKNHIRSRKKKNEFERLFLEYCAPVMETALRSIELLEHLCPSKEAYCICHGDYNQHNVLRWNGNWYMIHMESITYGLPVEDLAFFLRKMMEKNRWDATLGKTLIREYIKEFPLTEEEYGHLYALMLFPERFWKITNHYMNSHKAWVSQRDIEKLEKVIAQEKNRMDFVENFLGEMP
jgi:CotS family spore coat protein